MNQYIAAGSAQKIPHYDCRPYNYTQQELRERGSQNITLGVAFIVYGITAEICYIIAMMAMLTKELRRLSCYKIMTVLGIYDMLAIGVNSLMTGYLWIIGAWYCSHPDLIYISGAIGLALWCGACMNCFVLVVNRILDLWQPHLVKKWFGGNRTFVVLLLPLVYCFYFGMYTPPLIFNSEKRAWFFDPFIVDHDEEKNQYYGTFGFQYFNYPHTANNLLIVVATCFLYVLVVGVLLKMFRLQQQAGFRQVSNNQLSIIFQATAICLANLIAALIYVYMQFFPTPKFLVLIGHMSWQAGHGMPAFVYLFMNKTIQFKLKSILCSCYIPTTDSSTTPGAECPHGNRTGPMPSVFE